MKHTLFLPLLLALCSCGGLRTVSDVPYFQNSREVFPAGSPGIGSPGDLVIRPHDRLVVFVFSGDTRSASQFNLRDGQVLSASQQVSMAGMQGSHHRYLVGSDGTVDYPLVGRLRLGGQTVEQAAQTVRRAIVPYVKDADGSLTVTVMIDNFYVSVLGEVRTPLTFDVSRPRLTVLEALVRAGDLTAYGRRDRVKLLRERDGGDYEVHELDLRDARLLESPYYYLRQRDIVYVEPNEVKSEESRIGQTTQLWVRGAGITISLGSLLYRVLQ